MSSTRSSDIEASKTPKEFLEGYADFAEFIASDDDLSIYRRFRPLSARNLLYLQAELQVLEARLRDLDEKSKAEIDNGRNLGEKMEILQAARDWESFVRKAELGDERQMEKLKVVVEIRRVMKEYQEALLLQSKVLALDTPGERVLDVFTRWFELKQPLAGYGGELLSDKADIVSLRKEVDPDRLSKFMQDHFGYLFKEASMDKPLSWGNMYYFPQKSIARLVAIVSVLLSAILLIGAIVALYYVPASDPAKLGILGAFTILFAGSIGLLTNARRAEVFGATAAYAAVLVVFVSGNYSKSESL